MTSPPVPNGRTVYEGRDFEVRVGCTDNVGVGNIKIWWNERLIAEKSYGLDQTSGLVTKTVHFPFGTGGNIEKFKAECTDQSGNKVSQSPVRVTILKDNPPTIEHFEVTHGFNILTAGYMRRSRPVHWRVGAGVTLPNTFATVRGELSDVHDYAVAGPAFLAGAGSELALTRRLFLAAEAQFIAAWATVDVARGEARVASLAVHVLFGAGFVF